MDRRAAWLFTVFLFTACAISSSSAEEPATADGKPKPGAKAVLPADPGLGDGKNGHWGAKNDKDWIDGRWSATDVGPFVSCALAVPGGNINKGIAIKVGEGGIASVCFDSERCGIGAAWTGGFVKFGGKRFGLIEAPAADGASVFSLPGEDRWAAKARYQALCVNGSRVTLNYEFADGSAMESPWAEQDGAGLVAVSTTIQINTGASGCSRTMAGLKDWKAAAESTSTLAILEKNDEVLAAALVGAGVLLAAADGRIKIDFPARASNLGVKVLLWRGKKTELARFTALAAKSEKPEELRPLTEPGPARWGVPLTSKGSVSADKRPYVIDSIAVPFENRFKALFFCSGIDFLPNGDAVVSTLHGDVWRVGGLDAKLENVTWTRMATGLFQPIGVKVRNGEVYVLGRDQVTRLVDKNGDGEADVYANFCNLMKTSPSGHDYSAGLETDGAGNFYHVDPFGLHRISSDGRKYETVAGGWRNPVSLSVGPDDAMFVAPQEGEWTPASMICEVAPGGHYGFPKPKVTDARPLGYDPPACYIPRKVDNSSGGFAWGPAKDFGPLSGQLLNLSFGQCAMQMVLRDRVNGRAQATVVPLPLRFPAGLLRGNANVRDGCLYLVGTQGWVTSAVRDGCLQRVRYTGAKMCLPVAVNVHANGLKLTFSEPLDAETVADPENFSIEQWNYRYTSKYGSEEYSVEHPDVIGHDQVKVAKTSLSSDGRVVFLAIDGLKPVMQMRVKYILKDAGGANARGEFSNTINALGEPFSLASK